MSIDKYKKGTPDITIPDSAWLSTDGTNLRGYKLVNAENIGLEWCYTTNYNNTKRYDKTYINVGDKTLETSKTGLYASSIEQTTLYGTTLYKVNVETDSFEWDKIGAGMAIGLLHLNPNSSGLSTNYSDLYVIENLDYSKIVVTAYGFTTGQGSWSIDAADGEQISTSGMLTSVKAFDRVTKTIRSLPSPLNLNLYFGTVSSEFTFIDRLGGNTTIEPQLQIGVRGYREGYSAYVNKSFEKPYATNGSYNLAYCMTTDTKYVQTVVLPMNDFAKFTEKTVWHSQSGDTYGAYFTECSNCDDIIKALNSTGLYYADDLIKTWDDFAKNVHLGVMDDAGVTDCNNRLTGIDEIDASDLPNKSRSGYDWEIQDPTKPVIDIDKDDTEKMSIGGFYTAGGLVNYYSIVNTPQHNYLNELSENLSNWDYVETGKDVLRNLISLKAIPISRELLCRGINKEITIAGTNTGVTGQTVDSTYDVINLGTISIPHRYNDFRDYAPYAKIEICVPFGGWVPLPSHCMGHSISVKMTYDIITGNCRIFAVLDDNTIVAETVGNIAMDIPFTADAVGMKSANMISSLTGVASSALSLGAGIVSGNTMGTASGIVGLANSVTQTICANNANYTETKGNTGDANNFSGVKQCFLKITYPISHIPDSYGREIGYLYNKTETLSHGMGYTKTANTYISGSMTETEKNEIITIMESGVIL